MIAFKYRQNPIGVNKKGRHHPGPHSDLQGRNGLVGLCQRKLFLADAVITILL